MAAIGIGNRTGKYLRYFSLHPDDVQLVAVVEPDPVRREACRRQFSLPSDRCFASADIFFDRFREPCDGVIIGSPDRCHYGQALKAIDRGWHILLEKPVAQSYGQCLDIAAAAGRKGVKVGVCYVLRFMPSYRKVKELVGSGAIGSLERVAHQEFIGIDRMLHTYVRGYWNKAAESNPSFVSKCCHDVDMLLWTTGARIADVGSKGGLKWYRPENAPEGSTDRCIDCPVESGCAFSAVDMYLRRGVWTRNFPVPEGKTLEEVLENEIATGRYGRCAFRCDNDVADCQKVTLTAEGGAVLTIEMNALTRLEGRRTVFSGTLGRIVATEDYVEVRDGGGTVTGTFAFPREGDQSFHANADLELVGDFARAVATPGLQPAVTLDDSLESLRICFLAG